MPRSPFVLKNARRSWSAVTVMGAVEVPLAIAPAEQLIEMPTLYVPSCKRHTSPGLATPGVVIRDRAHGDALLQVVPLPLGDT